jgi:hypothetical protein
MQLLQRSSSTDSQQIESLRSQFENESKILNGLLDEKTSKIRELEIKINEKNVPDDNNLFLKEKISRMEVDLEKAQELQNSQSQIENENRYLNALLEEKNRKIKDLETKLSSQFDSLENISDFKTKISLLQTELELAKSLNNNHDSCLGREKNLVLKNSELMEKNDFLHKNNQEDKKGI